MYLYLINYQGKPTITNIFGCWNPTYFAPNCGYWNQIHRVIHRRCDEHKKTMNTCLKHKHETYIGIIVISKTRISTYGSLSMSQFVQFHCWPSHANDTIKGTTNNKKTSSPNGTYGCKMSIAQTGKLSKKPIPTASLSRIFDWGNDNRIIN